MLGLGFTAMCIALLMRAAGQERADPSSTHTAGTTKLDGPKYTRPDHGNCRDQTKCT